MLLASRNQCGQWAAANECVTNAIYIAASVVCFACFGQLCMILGCVRVLRQKNDSYFQCSMKLQEMPLECGMRRSPT